LSQIILKALMAKSQQTFSKNEKEKKRLKKREDKKKKMDARKADREASGGSGIEFAYVDHMGNLVDTPPDPDLKVEIEAEDIILGIPKTPEGEREAFDPVRTGTVDFYDSSKGFGFIIDGVDKQKYFCHVSGLKDDITEGNLVSFELEKGQRGMNAVKVTLVK
jgi:cold shock CspA family protein